MILSSLFIKLLVSDTISGLRIDLFLVQHIHGLSRNQAIQALRQGRVTVSGKVVFKRVQLKPGETVELLDFLPAREKSSSTVSPIDVVYEDNDLLVVNKPPGILTHPAHGTDTETLLDRLLSHCKGGLSSVRGPHMAGVVHRLDKDTSGLLLVAKHNDIHRALAQQIEARKVSKFYLALLHGRLTPHKGSIEAPLLKAESGGVQKLTRVSLSPRAKWALTHYEVIEYLGNSFTLVRAHIITGRTHQIRAHFSSIGHPVVGDSSYGSSDTVLGAPRQFLHATRLILTHPVTQKTLDLEIPLPSDLNSFLERLKTQFSLF